MVLVYEIVEPAARSGQEDEEADGPVGLLLGSARIADTGHFQHVQ